MDEDKRNTRPQTTVLTDEERRSFQGMTIDENGRDAGEDEKNAHTADSPFSGSYQAQGFKIYTLSSLGWKGKLVLAAVICVVLGIVIFFGSIFLIGFGIIAGLAAVLALIRILYRMLTS